LVDFEAQKKLWIRYDYVPNERRINSYEHMEIGVMMRQLALWGTAPLTEKFIWRLGDRDNDELILASRKRKRDAEKADERASKVAALSQASINSHGTYHPLSPPPSSGLAPDLSMTSTVDYSCPPSQQPVSHNTHTDIIQPPTQNYNVTYSENFSFGFEITFATWLDEENVSKAAIGRLLRDPVMAPLTRNLTWKSERQMRAVVERFGGTSTT
jgi:hypothetical protein